MTSAREETEVLDPEVDEDLGPLGDELPPRPRRRWLTPLTGGLLAVLVAACGFLAGVLVEKSQSSSSTASSAAGRRAALLGAASAASGGGGRAGGGTFSGAGATVGQVTTLRGDTLYVSTVNGNTVEVKIPSGEKISQTTNASPSAIHPGDTVIVQGGPASDGTVTATSVRDTPAGVSAGGGLGGLFGGGGGGGGAGRSGGGSSSGGNQGGGSGGSQLFGPG